MHKTHEVLHNVKVNEATVVFNSRISRLSADLHVEEELDEELDDDLLRRLEE